MKEIHMPKKAKPTQAKLKLHPNEKPPEEKFSPEGKDELRKSWR